MDINDRSSGATLGSRTGSKDSYTIGTLQTDTSSGYIFTNKKKWFYRLKGENGLLADLSDDDKLFQLIVSFINSEGTRFYSAFDSHIDFLQYMSKLPLEKRCFHEVVIEKRPQKMRFDLDIKKSDDISFDEVKQFIDELIDACIQEFEQFGFRLEPQKHILLYSSNGEKKWSYHIIIDGFYCESHNDAAALFKEITSRMSTIHLDWIDASIYSVNHCLRILGCVKEGQDAQRVKILEHKWKYRDMDIEFEYSETPVHDLHRLGLEFERSFLTLTSTCYPLPSLATNANGATKFVPEKQAEEEVIDYAFSLIRDIYGTVFSYMSSMGNIVMMKRNCPSGCPICHRVHEHENAFLYVKPVKTENEVIQKYEIYFDCRRSNGKKVMIGEKLMVDEEFISKDEVVEEKSSRSGFSLEDMELASRTSIKNLK